VAVRSAPARLYNLLHLHYVGGLTLQETANDLGISLRQAYRDLRRGQQSVAEMLWFNRVERLPTSAAQLSSPDTEVARLEGNFTVTNLTATLEMALKAVHKLAESHSVSLNVSISENPAIITTSQAAAQQILIHVLSQAIRQSKPGILDVTLEAETGDIHLCVCYIPRHEPEVEMAVAPVIGQLIAQLRWQLSHQTSDSGAHVSRIKMSFSGSTVLIIDDNEGLVDLLQHYFSGMAYRVTAAMTGAEGLKLAEELLPDAILMDLMMPGMDGWELLQRLRSNPLTRDIPVIICSVINDPELAYSLGASLFIAKPVSRDIVLKALQETGI
jgi:CheY-like chemotaxis protein